MHDKDFFQLIPITDSYLLLMANTDDITSNFTLSECNLEDRKGEMWKAKWMILYSEL